MSEISAGGKKFKKGEIVEYIGLDGKSLGEFIVIGQSKDNPPGLILKGVINGRQFAIGAVGVAARVNKIPQPPPQPPPTPSEMGSLGGRIPPRDDLNNKGNNPPPPPPQNPPPPPPPREHKFRKFWNRIKPKGNIKENLPPLSRVYYEVLILLAILAHLADAFWLSFSISPAAIGYRIMLYFILGVFVHFILNRGWSTFDSVIEIAKVSAIPLLIVPLISIILNIFSVGADVIKVISTITLAFPIWLYYIMYIREKKPEINGNIWNKLVNLLFTPSGWAKIWFFVLVILALFNILTFLGTMISGGAGAISGAGGDVFGGGGGFLGLGGIPGAQDSGFNVQTSIDGLSTFISTSVNKFTSSINAFFKGAANGFANLQNQTMGQYYTGQVEQNKEQTGVFITDFHVTGKQYDSMPVVAYGYIKARSFVNNITIYPSCYAQSMTNKSRVFQGTVDPPKLDNIYIEDQRGVICTFDGYGALFGSVSGTLPADRYQIFLTLDFNFETWAYKQYYFLDRNYLVYLKTSGVDPNTKLQIPQKTKTIYTNGPVMIGMDDAVEMPFAISSDTMNYLPIGMTIDDKPQLYGVKGQVVRVYNYSLRMPTEFKIGTKQNGGLACTVPSATKNPDPTVPDYTIYTFDVASRLANSGFSNFNLSGAYMTLNCNIEIPKESVLSIIPTANTPAIVSVVGTTNYDYRLTKQIPVTVEKTPGT